MTLVATKTIVAVRTCSAESSALRIAVSLLLEVVSCHSSSIFTEKVIVVYPISDNAFVQKL